MPNINTVTSLANSNITNYEKRVDPKDAMGRDDFLKMLVTQLQNQDPLNPMEGTEFTAQLAQFSNLEQQFNTNDNLEEIKKLLSEGSEDNLLDYIGKEVSGNNDMVTLKDGSSTTGSYTIERPADVMTTIYDQEGHEVKSIYHGQKTVGSHDISWDGKNNNGEIAADGKYVYQVMALDAVGGLVPAKTRINGTVTGVTYEHGVPYLKIDETLIDPATIVEVNLSQNKEDYED